jgi:magnesium-transporting ATPase (P-type)
MGIAGTDVAREAADMVLADDNFASIVAAVEEGRAVYDNVRKFVTYIFASNIPEIVPFIAFVLFRIPLPLTVMQILAVDLGTDLMPALALGAEPPEPGVMRDPPRPRHQRLLNLPILLRAYAWLGMIEAGLSLIAFYFAYWIAGWRPGQTLAAEGNLYATATTMSLAGIVACQIGNVLVCRSARRPMLRLDWRNSRLLMVGVIVEIALLLAAIYMPFFASVFGLAPLRPVHWLFLATFPPILVVCEESRKWLARRAASRKRHSRTPQHPLVRLGDSPAPRLEPAMQSSNSSIACGMARPCAHRATT